jgi:peptidoglycan/xylan/chitin deacetylase (PgdA/CDA1 family)
MPASIPKSFFITACLLIALMLRMDPAHARDINVVSASVDVSTSNPTINVKAENVVVNAGELVFTVFASISSERHPGSVYWLGLSQNMALGGSMYTNSGGTWEGSSIWPFPEYEDALISVWVCNEEVTTPSCPAANMLLLAEVEADPGVSALAYHLISDPAPNDPNAALYVSPTQFNEQMEHLATNGFETLFATEIDDYREHLKAAVVTIDDGYADNYINAYPALLANGVKATIFIVPNLVGQPGYLTLQQIQEMQASGLVSFQNHTMGHQDLRRAIPNQIGLAQAWIQSQLGASPSAVAYPYGFFNEASISEAEATGHTHGFTVNPGRFYITGPQLKDHKFRIRRQLVPYGTQVVQFNELLIP